MSSKTPEGELTAPELRKLIRAHNILSKIVIPKGTDRQGLIKLIEGKNYKVDHEKKVIRPKQQRGKQITLKKAEELTKPKPVSEEVKKKRAEKKKEQEEAKQKDIKIAKKEAVKEFKSKQKEAKKKQVKKPVKKPVKKEDEVRPKEKVGRPKVDPKKIKVIEPKKEEKYNLFLKLFNEAKERRNRKPFQELRDRIFRYSEPFLYGTKLKPKSDGETLKAQKDPEFLKIKSLLDKVDNELEKYFKIGGLKYPKPKPLIISNKPALNTKKIEPKKKTLQGYLNQGEELIYKSKGIPIKVQIKTYLLFCNEIYSRKKNKLSIRRSDHIFFLNCLSALMRLKIIDNDESNGYMCFNKKKLNETTF